jgi:mRNA interferase RelE/StbE
MTNFEIILKRSVSKELKKLSKPDRIRIYKALEKLKDPFSLDIRKLKGLENTYAVRIGDFRIVFKIYFERKMIFVVKIDKRERVYDRI